MLARASKRSGGEGRQRGFDRSLEALAGHSEVVAVARAAVADTPDVRFIAGDLRSKDGVDAVAAAALDHLGGVDIIVNNAGASRLPPGGALAIEPDQWQEDLDV
ncbi:MAG: hypothetical protein QOD38_746, partial [Acidimicrobiaceae bacterium]